ncbi:MAG: pectate lyase [Verrucomicrobia bacterium]|nr:pectate lyase [Verrucomicrobiota bacterium]
MIGRLLLLCALATVASPRCPGAVRWSAVLRQPATWYATAEAHTVADNVLLWQTPSGGWPKNHDMTVPPAPHDLDAEDVSAPTIDNDATWTQLRFLALVEAAQPDARYRAAFQRGLDYLFAAQYANGGWPQFYPRLPGYYTHITFNDDAMTGVLELLRDVARGKAPYDKIDDATRTRAAAAVKKGLACILRCQITVNGQKTVWCAQHDEITFEPVPARTFEHESLSGSESVGVVRFLMGEENPSPEIIAAVQGAVAWFEQVKLTGIRVIAIPDPKLPHGHDRKVVADPSAPPLWARFYEIGTNRPIFGGRDTIIRYTLAEVEPERRGGYRWYVEEPAKLLEKDYPRWAARWIKSN